MSHEREMRDTEYEELMASLYSQHRRLKLALCGRGECGKDEAASWFNRNTSARYSGFSTSKVIAPIAAQRLGISVEAAFMRRRHDRRLWQDIGNELRASDAASLARTVLQHGDIVVGIREAEEISAVINGGLVDLAIWIDRDTPPDPMTYGPELCHIIVQNRGTISEFHSKLHRLAECLGILKSQVEVAA